MKAFLYSQRVFWLITTGIMLFSLSLNAQTDQGTKYNYSANLEYFDGQIFEHSPHIPEGLITEGVYGMQLDLERNTNGSRIWESVYGYPDLGVSLLYIDYNNAVIGQSIAALAYMRLYIFGSHQTKHSLRLKLGHGISYHTNPYDEETNRLNPMLGSSFSYTAMGQFSYGFWLSKRLNIHGGYSFFHFSNGASKKPNLGINTGGLQFGLSYKITDHKIENQKNHGKLPSQPFQLGVTFATGANESEEFKARGAFVFYNFGLELSKRLSHKSALHVGSELMLSGAIKEDIRIDDAGNGDYKRVGIYFGHELIIGRSASISAQVGYHVYMPYDIYTRVYKRLSMNYNIDKWTVGLALKSYSTKAEAAELRLGYKIF